jgi:hypothetical protein
MLFFKSGGEDIENSLKGDQIIRFFLYGRRRGFRKMLVFREHTGLFCLNFCAGRDDFRTGTVHTCAGIANFCAGIVSYLRRNCRFLRGNCPYLRGNRPYLHGNRRRLHGNRRRLHGNRPFLQAYLRTGLPSVGFLSSKSLFPDRKEAKSCDIQRRGEASLCWTVSISTNRRHNRIITRKAIFSYGGFPQVADL